MTIDQQAEVIPVNVIPPHKSLPLGAEFTIQGVRITGPGRFTTTCAPGEETRLVVSNRPSVFRLAGPRELRGSDMFKIRWPR